MEKMVNLFWDYYEQLKVQFDEKIAKKILEKIAEIKMPEMPELEP